MSDIPPPPPWPEKWGVHTWRRAYAHAQCPMDQGFSLVRTHRAARHRCLACGEMMFLDLPATTEELAAIPAYEAHKEPCVRCGTTEGTELHHWAPVELFGIPEANQWPRSYLCEMHHHLWHKKVHPTFRKDVPRKRLDGLGDL
jgi:hypothetical protein